MKKFISILMIAMVAFTICSCEPSPVDVVPEENSVPEKVEPETTRPVEPEAPESKDPIIPEIDKPVKPIVPEITKPEVPEIEKPKEPEVPEIAEPEIPVIPEEPIEPEMPVIPTITNTKTLSLTKIASLRNSGRYRGRVMTTFADSEAQIILDEYSDNHYEASFQIKRNLSNVEIYVFEVEMGYFSNNSNFNENKIILDSFLTNSNNTLNCKQPVYVREASLDSKIAEKINTTYNNYDENSNTKAPTLTVICTKNLNKNNDWDLYYVVPETLSKNSKWPQELTGIEDRDTAILKRTAFYNILNEMLPKIKEYIGENCKEKIN